MPQSPETILDELRRVTLPSGGDIVALDMVKAVSVDGGRVSFVLEVPTELGSRMEPVRAAAKKIVEDMPGVEAATVVLTAHNPASAGTPGPGGQPPDLKIGRHPRQSSGPSKVPGVGRIIAVASGKGGVGKSTVASNLAVSLARSGYRAGLLDADIHGPSLPRMMGVSKKPTSPDGKTMIPLRAHGLEMMSIGLLLSEQEPVIWRGPMLMGAVQQMLQQVKWSDLDVLVVDLPPGTGDVQLTLCQNFVLAGAVVVCTPQDVALLDARRAIGMFKKMNVPVLGLIENMSGFVCPNCGERSEIFGSGGVREEAARTGIEFLGAIPIYPEIRVSGDNGRPVAVAGGPASDEFESIARKIASPR